MSSSTATSTDFVPADLDATSWAQLAPLYQSLLDRPIENAADLERWLLDRSELDAAVSQARAELYIPTTRFTNDAEASQRWDRFLDEVPTQLDPMSFALNRRQVELAERLGLSDGRYAVLHRSTRNEVTLFRNENVALDNQDKKLNQKYQQLCGKMSVEFDGQTLTLPQVAKYLEMTDRAKREGAWRAERQRRLVDRDAVDAIYDEQVRVRTQIARNAGFDNYRDYQHQNLRRFEYTSEDCYAFHEGVERHIVPFRRELDARRKAALGVDPLRPWDLNVDELGREPLRPFTTGQQLVEQSRRVFARMDAQLSAFYNQLGDDMGDRPGLDGCFDLDSRPGKSFGGYQYMRDRSRRPFIFMNAAGLHRDVETMIHEAGHAFHSMLSKDEPLVAYREAPIEFAEVASMSMELLTMPYWDEFYPNPSDANRARRAQLEGSLSMLTWIATIDAFQHWVYLNPGHTRAQRYDYWNTLMDRFGHDVSWDGLEAEKATTWQRQLHLFGHAFYYIEYGIAQLGAFGLWMRSLNEGQSAAIQGYKDAMTLGGSQPLPKLFEAAGLKFDMGADHIGRVVQAVRTELAKLPD
jgi:oligoendopeptidase F